MKRLFLFIFGYLLLGMRVYGTSLDELALRCKTDKASSEHNYTVVYEKYFDALRDKPLKILEIGFAQGASARLWDQYFSHPETKIFFIDNEKYSRHHTKMLSSRCRLYIADQADARQLEEFIKTVDGNFDIIIDDGGHEMNQQIISFKTLFPYVKKGGMYIIEDLHTSYLTRSNNSWKRSNLLQASTDSTINFLRDLIHDLNFVGARTGLANRETKLPLIKNLKEYQKTIASMHFYTSLCFIFKD